MKNVLLIDDDIDDQELFCEAIKIIDPTIDCEVASDAEEALVRLEQTNTLPLYIFLDINMPKMDGKNCLRALKENEKLKSIPVVMYSTTIDQEVINFCAYLGAEYMNKPTRFQNLVDVLSGYFKSQTNPHQ